MMDKKILLINPPKLDKTIIDKASIFPPLGLAYIAAVLEKEGYNVNIIDAYAEELSLHQIKVKIDNFSPNVVGITCDVSRVEETKQIFKLSTAFKIVGGPFATVKPDEFVDVANAIVIGEGEETMLELLKYFFKNKDFSKIKGLYNSPKRELIQNLDSLPMPSWHLLPMNLYYDIRSRDYPMISMFTSRGCPYNCIFCNSPLISGRKVRFMSPKRIVDNIEFLIRNYNIKEIFFKDSNFMINKSHLEKICDEILKRRLKVKWVCNGHVNSVDYDLLTKMKNAGCYLIYFGFESGNQKTLNKIRKGVTIENARRAAKITNKSGIRVGGMFMIGFPWENREKIQQTIDFAMELNLYSVLFSIVNPYPGTYLWDYCIAKNLINKNINWDNFDLSNPIIPLEDISKEDLQKILWESYRKFLYSPKHILNVTMKSNMKEILKKNYWMLKNRKKHKFY